MPEYNPNVVDYLSATIAGTSGSILTLADGGAVTIPNSARSYKGVLYTAAIRARGDGTAATASAGIQIQTGTTIYLSHSEITNMQFIREGATSGLIIGHFYDVPVSVLIQCT